MEWINIFEQAPENGQRVLAHFEMFNTIEIYTYKNVSDEEEGIFGTHCFYNHKGFLTDDIVYWMPLPENPPPIQYEVMED